MPKGTVGSPTSSHKRARFPELLQGAAKATVAQYDTLRIDSGEHPDVTVIIPVFDQFAYTYRCVQSLITHGARASFDVILVDDGSTDETLFASLVMFGDIRIVRNTRNQGFLKSVNIAAQLARGRFLFLLNNDTEVQDGWLDELVQTFERDPTVGIAGSKLLYPNGLLQEAGGIVWRDGSAMNWGRQGDPDEPQYCFMRDVDYVSGAALMIERSVFEAVGGLSEEFAPAYYEDTDLCFKVRASGRRVVLQPQSRVVHHEGVTSGTDVGGSGIKRFQRINHRTFALKWLAVLQDHGFGDTDLAAESERGVTKRVLFIDDTVPTPDQDAGSNAALSYMLGLQRLGFKVSFASDNGLNVPRYTRRLEALGIQCYYSPYIHSIAEILEKSSAAFDVFYVHRLANMQKYAPSSGTVFRMRGSSLHGRRAPSASRARGCGEEGRGHPAASQGPQKGRTCDDRSGGQRDRSFQLRAQLHQGVRPGGERARHPMDRRRAADADAVRENARGSRSSAATTTPPRGRRHLAGRKRSCPSSGRRTLPSNAS